MKKLGTSDGIARQEGNVGGKHVRSARQHHTQARLAGETALLALFPVPLLMALVLGTTTNDRTAPLEPTTNQSDPLSPVPLGRCQRPLAQKYFKIPAANQRAMFSGTARLREGGI